MLEVFNNLFMAIAEQMGVTLANTAYSVNIKERLDFSCALFDAEGNLIASTDGLGNTSVMTYNALNQPVISRDALGNQAVIGNR